MMNQLLTGPHKPPIDLKGSLVFSEAVASGCRYVRIKTDLTIPASSPGQFFLLRESRVSDPLLGRPFASINASRNSVDFLFRVVGRGTEILASLPPGTRVDLRGPCGNGFPVPRSRRLILVAGTLGIAPFFDAALRYGSTQEIITILGVPGHEWREFAGWCKERIPDIRIVSDDGKIGNSGTAVEEAVSMFRSEDEVWACGPIPMLKNMGILHSAGCGRLFVSIERRMACGMGGCLGCSLQTCSGTVRACVEGPVLEWKEVLWNE